MDDALFLGRSDLPGVDMECDAVLFAEVTQDGLLVRAGGILTQSPYTAVGVSADDMVDIELENAR